MSLQMELSGLATAWICPLSTASLSAENGVKPCWERQLFTSAHTFSPTVARDSFRLKELENMRHSIIALVTHCFPTFYK